MKWKKFHIIYSLPKKLIRSFIQFQRILLGRVSTSFDDHDSHNHHLKEELKKKVKFTNLKENKWDQSEIVKPIAFNCMGRR